MIIVMESVGEINYRKNRDAFERFPFRSIAMEIMQVLA